MVEDRGLVREFFALRDKIIENRYKDLSEEQKKAVFSTEKYILLVACPGAGKTKTLISRIDYLTTFGTIYKSEAHGIVTKENIKLLTEITKNKDGYIVPEELRQFSVPPDNIQVITFTKAAASEMKNRYKAITNGGYAPFFGTFHSLFYKILRCSYKSISIINEKDQLWNIKDILRKYIGESSIEKVKAANNAISLYNASGRSVIDKKILEHCIYEYEDYKNKKNVMDFDDLQIRCIDMLNNNIDILKKYRKKFQYILVDEFQDSAKKEMEFLKLFKENSSIFVVGDEDQSIYCFRGANPYYMMNFNKEFKGASKLFLSKNYRSKDDIVLNSSKLISFNKDRNEKNICSYRNGKESIHIEYFKEEFYQNFFIGDTIKSDYDKFKNRTAILYRTNKEAELISNSFIAKEIPFFFLNKQYNIYDNPICSDIMCYIKLASNKKDITSFIQIANKPNRGISREVLDDMLQKSCYGEWFYMLKNCNRVSIEALRKSYYFSLLLNMLNIIPLNKKISYIRHVLRYDDYLLEYCKTSGEHIENLEKLMEKFNYSVCNYKNLSNENIKEGVLLSTIHGAKGMEFDNVFVINCCEGIIPYEKSIEREIEDERRLFYVGITRAKNELWLTVPEKISGINRECSRFVKELNGSVE